MFDAFSLAAQGQRLYSCAIRLNLANHMNCINRILVSLLLGATALTGWAADKKPKHPALASDTVVWAGLDFTKVKMIGPGQFTEPENIFPGMLTAWNNLFLQERLRTVE